jgi:hypothetical protein
MPSEATILIVDEDGTQVYKGTTPATVTLQSGKAYFDARQYTVTFSKAGYEDQVTYINPGIDGWYFGNILLGGAIGMLIVDPLTGAMWTLPRNVTVTLADKVALKKEEMLLEIVTIDQVPDKHKKDLIRIN